MLHVDLKLFFWVSEFFFFFYEFDLMTNGLSVYNGCQSRVSVETCAFEFCILNSWIYMYEKYF